jgi:hypothetical protein
MNSKFEYRGVLTVSSVRTNFGFDVEEKYNLTYVKNGKDKRESFIGKEIFEVFEKLECDGCQGTVRRTQ